MNFILVWCKNAGIYKNFDGVMNMQEPRYLCEKHFSSNYICTQARRKMLVHTAVPERCKDFEDYEVNFAFLSDSNDRKRKMNRDYTFEELSLPVTKRVIVASPTILNNVTPETPKPLRISSRNNSTPSTSATVTSATITSVKPEKSPSHTIKVQRKGVTSAATSKSPAYEEIAYQSPKKYSLLVVKPKPEKKPTILNVNAASCENLIEENQEFLIEEEHIEENQGYSIEEENISSTQLVDDKPEEPEKAEQMEMYSEFIFNGEMFVQMPKRVFEAEKNRIKKECEKYKQLLRKLKSHLAKMPDLD